MADYYSGNFFLSETQMQVNAKFIYNYLSPRGWTLNAIAGLLGNTETESTHNPGIWQNLKVDVGPGYSLTQWTPYTKYTNWCADTGRDPAKMESALDRILWEVENNEQWVRHEDWPLSFKQFTVSEESPYYLGMTFLNNYEMPEDLNQPQRGEDAEKWYTFLSGEEPPGPGPDPRPPDRNVYTQGKSFILPLLMYHNIMRRK